jgi:hypothetical protein
MESKKTPNCQSSLNQNEHCWKYHNTWLQEILQTQ